jgi:hypothetical protein
MQWLSHEYHVDNATESEAAPVPAGRDLASLRHDPRQRGWSFLNNNTHFQKNPRLPVSRGFFVWKQPSRHNAGTEKKGKQ